MENNKHISNFNAHEFSRFLLHIFSINGSFRDETDFNRAKHLSIETLNLILDFISNINGTNEEKKEYLEKVKEDLNKFTLK